MSDWLPEPRPVPVELTPDFEHPTYPKPATFFEPLADRLDHATRDQLLALAKGTL